MKFSMYFLLFALVPSVTFADGSFSNKYITLDLPEGWTAQPADESAMPHMGTIKSSKLAGTSITLDCYRGALNTHSSTRIRALKTIATAYPAGQEQVKDKVDIKTQNGKGAWESWKGYVQVGNQMVELSSPMAAVKTPHCWLVMIGYTAAANSVQLESDFLTILKTAR